MTDQVGNSKRDHARFASPSAGQHQQRPRECRHRFGLRSIESVSRVQSVRLMGSLEVRAVQFLFHR